MTISRRQLYAAGEALGDCATYAKPGGRVMGFGGDSSSATTQQQTTLTTNNDNRQAISNNTTNTTTSTLTADSNNTSNWLTDTTNNTNTNTYNTKNTSTNTDNRNFSSTITDASVRSQSNSTTDSNNSLYSLLNSGNTTTSTTSNITLSDSGAISAGRDISLSALSNNATNFDHLTSLSSVLFSKVGDLLNSNVTLAGQLASGANQAYSDATAQSSGNKNVMLAALAVVAIVGASAFLKR